MVRLELVNARETIPSADGGVSLDMKRRDGSQRLPTARRRSADEALRAELDRSKRQLALLLGLSRPTSEAFEVGPLVERVLAEIVPALAVDACTIHLVEGDELVLAGSRDECDPPLLDEGPTAVPIDGATLAGRTAQEVRTVVVGPERNGRRCVAATPLAVQGRVIGAITVYRSDETAFETDEVRLLEVCGTQLGAAIEQARLFEEERRRVLDLSLINEIGGLLTQHLELSEVLSAGVRNAAHIANVPQALLFLLDPDGRLLRAAATSTPHALDDLVLPLDQPGLAASSVRERRPVAVYEGALERDGAGPTAALERDGGAAPVLVERFGLRAILAVPLLFKGEPIGLLVLADTRPGRRFTAAEMDRAVAVGHPLAAAIANARLYEAERRRADDLNLLLEVGRVVTATLDLERILEASAGSLARMVDATSTYIWLLEAGELRGVTTSAREHRAHFSTVRLRVDEPSLVAQAVRLRSAAQAIDAQASPLVNRELIRRYGSRSLLALPLLHRGEPIGAAVIADERVRAWLPSEIERATVMARQVAVAVANARLFDDLRTSYETLARTQRALVERERLAALGELAAVVAHEVRNPLGVIWNSLVSLRKLVRPRGDVGTLLDILGEESDRLNRIVADLLDFTRPQMLSLRVEPIDALVAGAVEAARSAGLPGGVEIRLAVQSDVPPVWADGRLVRQALINLVTNAAQAMPRGGRVTIAASLERAADVPLVRIDVTDEGPGIDSEAAQQVFQPFFTTKATGTGLGLAVVKRIVEAHEGRIDLESGAGRGTTFTVRLPLVPASGRPSEPPPEPASLDAPRGEA